MKICENGIVRDMTAEEVTRLERLRSETVEPTPTPDDRIAELEAQNQMLTECLMEMSQVVYA